MPVPARRFLLIGLFAFAIVVLSIAPAFAIPVIQVGQGIPNGQHSTYPGLCTNCHSFAVWPAPAIDAGELATHGFRGDTCTQCHVVNVTPPPPPPPPPPVPGTLTVTTLKGASRYETAIAVSKQGYPSGAPALVLATGANFPDALCAAPLATALGGPMLLVPSASSLDAKALAEINRLHPSTIVIVGAGGAVSSGIEAQVRALSWGPSVTRIAGGDRFATAALVADAVKAKTGSGAKVVVANGMTYADALSVAPLAAAKGWPILLTNATTLPAQTGAAITRLGATSCVVIGGTGVVSPGVMAQLPGATRKGGTDRYDTCAVIADYAVTNGMSFATVGTTVGNNFPDALAAGPLLAKLGGVLMLTPPNAVSSPMTARLTAHKADVDTLVVIGGALQQATIDRMRTLID
ncbi:MAG: cell wall-binding repeat-containing protein [Coriobacteriia bacterium]